MRRKQLSLGDDKEKSADSLTEDKIIMGKKYENPPIIEAICEFRLPPEAKWDMTIPGLIYEKIKNQYPNKEQRLFQEVEVIQTPEGRKEEGHISEHVLFRTDDKKELIRLGRNLIALSCLKPYPTWSAFKPRIDNAFCALKEIIDIKNLQRIGLRYINRIDIPKKSPKLSDYFEFRPFVGKKLPQDMRSFIVGCVLNFFDERDACRIELTSAVPKGPDFAAYLLDFDYHLASPQAILADEASEWIEEAHGRI